MWSEVRRCGAVDFTDVLCWSIRDGRAVLVVWYRLILGRLKSTELWAVGVKDSMFLSGGGGRPRSAARVLMRRCSSKFFLLSKLDPQRAMSNSFAAADGKSWRCSGQEMEQKRHGEEGVGRGDGREAKRQGRDPQRVAESGRKRQTR